MENQHIFFHEIKNNLANIYSMIELIEDDFELFKEYAPLIKSSIMSVKDIERDYNIYINTGIHGGKCQTVMLGDVLNALCDEYKIMAAEYRVSIARELENIKYSLDVTRFKQMAGNLLSNAVKYNVDGGCVHVTLCRRENKVCLIVKDTGIGIMENEIKKLGTAFYRSKRKDVMGSGLGWATIFNICKLFEWKYTITNTKYWNTIVTIII
jgi:signal transduction histidine kinase